MEGCGIEMRPVAETRRITEYIFNEFAYEGTVTYTGTIGSWLRRRNV
jgi:hypothetical protein